MKKLVCLLAVLAMAAGLNAATTITAVDNGDGTITIGYTGDDPCAVGLVVDGCNPISYVGDTDSWFDTFIDYAYDPSTGDPCDYVLGTGNPLADVDEAGLPNDPCVVSLCLGHLEAANGGTGNIATLDVGCDCDVTVSIDTLRGNPEDLQGLPIAMTTSCAPACPYLGSDEMAEWMAVGEPDCWCNNEFQCRGDANGQLDQVGKQSFQVSGADLAILGDGWLQPYGGDPAVDTWICADFNHTNDQVGKQSFRVAGPDLSILGSYWLQSTVPSCP